MKTTIISIFLFVYFFAVVKGKDDIILEDVSKVVNERNGIALLKNQSAAESEFFVPGLIREYRTDLESDQIVYFLDALNEVCDLMRFSLASIVDFDSESRHSENVFLSITAECDPNVCKNGGTCNVVNNQIRCGCVSSYSGPYCETKKAVCDHDVCKNGGTCKVVSNQISCGCVSPYSGPYCETKKVRPCSSNPCQNGGTCIEYYISFDCICPSQYTGKNCSKKLKAGPCSSNPCQNGGICTENHNSFNCSCPSQYTGNNCELKGTDQPYSTDSSESTDWTDPTFSTETEQPYSTDSSESTDWTDPTFSKETEQPYSTDSSESTDWTDPTFSTETRQPYSTDSSESTDWTDPTFSTETEQPYTTDILSTTDWIDPTFSTETEQPYTTDILSTTDWTDPTLSTETEQPYSTDISSTTDWTDPTFSTAGVCDCGKHSIACYLDNEGKKMCICDVGYSQLFHTCIDCYCGEKSFGCFFDKSKEKKCLCKEGYAQYQEACRETCKYDRECLNGGICKISYGRVGFCECRADYSGDRCEINDICDHFNDVCQRYGAICVIKDGLPSCECPSDREGVTGLCENICTPDKCIHGRCEIFGEDFKCRCESGFEGKYCDSKIAPSKRDGIYFILIITGVVFILIFSIGMLCMAIYFRLKKKAAATDLESMVNDERTETN
nr:neurogenic locus Notch protein [Parasteatoda tepidariorum]